MCTVIIGYENSDHLSFSDFHGESTTESDFSSEDWISCTVRTRAGQFTGAYPAMFQWKEFKSLLDDLNSLAAKPSRTVRFQAIEGWIEFDMTIDRLGHVRVMGNAIASHEDCNQLSFQMKLDNMALSNAIKGLKVLFHQFRVG